MFSDIDKLMNEAAKKKKEFQFYRCPAPVEVGVGSTVWLLAASL